MSDVAVALLTYGLTFAAGVLVGACVATVRTTRRLLRLTRQRYD